MNLPLVFDVEMCAQFWMNLAYGSHLVHEIIHYNSTIYKLSNILDITQMEMLIDRFTNLDVFMP